MLEQLKILNLNYLEAYKSGLNMDLNEAVVLLNTKNSFTPSDFEYYLQSSAVYSSNIEGNSIEIDTFLKNKKFNIKSKPKETAEIDDLIAAYNFATATKLELKSFLATHKLLSKTILSLKSQRGKLRNQQVGIFSSGKVEYMAVEPDFVQEETGKLFTDIAALIEIELSLEGVFYYAAMIHLIFEKIHPFMDNNGRAGRLLEKWFLAEKIGAIAWSIKSEQYYAQNRDLYYKNIHIGPNYYTLKMGKCIPFLVMLPNALKVLI